MAEDMDRRVVDLETRLAFQEDTIQQLNDALVRQQADMERLQAAMIRLSEQVERLEPPEGAAENAPPPHY